MKYFCHEYNDKEIAYLQSLASIERDQENLSPAHKQFLNIKDKIAIFTGVDYNDLMQVVRNISFVKAKKHETIIKQGSVSRTIYFLLTGECTVYCDSVVVNFIKPGQVVGEIGVVFSKPRNATVLSNTDKTLLLSFELNDDVSDDYPHAFAQMYKNIIKELSIKLENSNLKRINDSYATHTAMGLYSL